MVSEFHIESELLTRAGALHGRLPPRSANAGGGTPSGGQGADPPVAEGHSCSTDYFVAAFFLGLALAFAFALGAAFLAGALRGVSAAGAAFAGAALVLRPLAPRGLSCLPFSASSATASGSVMSSIM